MILSDQIDPTHVMIVYTKYVQSFNDIVPSVWFAIIPHLGFLLLTNKTLSKSDSFPVLLSNIEYACFPHCLCTQSTHILFRHFFCVYSVSSYCSMTDTSFRQTRCVLPNFVTSGTLEHELKA